MQLHMARNTPYYPHTPYVSDLVEIVSQLLERTKTGSLNFTCSSVPMLHQNNSKVPANNYSFIARMNDATKIVQNVSFTW